MRAAALLFIGLFFGLIGAAIQTHTVTVGTTRVWTGAVLVVIVIVLVARAGAWWQGSRLGAVTFSVGWLAATLLMGSETTGGDLVITDGTRQLAYLVGGSMLLATACGFPLLPEDDHEVADQTPSERADA